MRTKAKTVQVQIWVAPLGTHDEDADRGGSPQIFFECGYSAAQQTQSDPARVFTIAYGDGTDIESRS